MLRLILAGAAVVVQSFQPSVQRLPAVRLAATEASLTRLAATEASYAEAIESDRVVLRRAAETKNEESDTVVDALLGLEQSCKERSRAEGETAGSAMADKLTGTWRLVFTTGTISRQERTGARVNYFPVKAVQSFDLPQAKITNGIMFGDFYAVRFFGPMEFNEKTRKLTFDFTRIELFNGTLGFDLGKGGAAEIGAATGLGSENNVKLAEQGKKPFFNWIDCDDVIATARGGGGGLALWTRIEEPS